MKSELKWVACPGCAADALFAPSNPYRPFCSKRCKLQDLGAWASEDFRMPSRETDADVGSQDDV